MKPTTTSYRLARRGPDYAKARKLLKAPKRMSWPTVVAVRDGEIIGCIGTHNRRNAVVAGFFFAPSPFVALRLVEAYERVLHVAGVREYIFALRPDTPKKWRHVVDENPDIVRFIGEHDGAQWYKRKLV